MKGERTFYGKFLKNIFLLYLLSTAYIKKSGNV